MISEGPSTSLKFTNLFLYPLFRWPSILGSEQASGRWLLGARPECIIAVTEVLFFMAKPVFLDISKLGILPVIAGFAAKKAYKPILEL